MRWLTGDDPGARAAAELLRGGGVVAIPTETVYGLAADALQPRAVARVFDAKGRPHFDPLIVHLPDADWLPRVVAHADARAAALAARFWPGPLTLVLTKRAEVPGIVTSGLDTVAVRVPAHDLARAVIEHTGSPLAAPSANPFGRVSPTTADHVAQALGGVIDAVVDGGPCSVGIESTIVDLSGAAAKLLRPGGVAIELIEAVIGPLEPVSSGEKPTAPGMLPSHYAPRTPLRLVETVEAAGCDNPKDCGLLVLTEPGDAVRRRFASVEVLSPEADLREAAANLFAALHRLDAAGVGQIVAVALPEHGLGAAVIDRLRRAARSAI